MRKLVTWFCGSNLRTVKLNAFHPLHMIVFYALQMMLSNYLKPARYIFDKMTKCETFAHNKNLIILTVGGLMPSMSEGVFLSSTRLGFDIVLYVKRQISMTQPKQNTCEMNLSKNGSK